MISQDAVQGHWRRDWLRAPGLEDRTTRVHWLQAGKLYADIRVPAERPALSGATCLAALAAPDLLSLMRAEGFAGTISLAGNVCTWTREVNWHGRPDTVDAGALRFEADGGLTEDGVHADYRELWSRLPGPAISATRVSDGPLSGLLVWSEAIFLLALGDPAAPSSAPLAAALARGERPTAALNTQFSSVYAFGRWDGPLGIADLSTNPFDEGQPVLERKGPKALVRHGNGFDGPLAPRALGPFSVPRHTPQSAR